MEPFEAVNPVDYIESEDFLNQCAEHEDIMSWINFVRNDKVYNDMLIVVKQIPVVMEMLYECVIGDKQALRDEFFAGTTKDNACAVSLLLQFDAGQIDTVLPPIPDNWINSRLGECANFINETIMFGDNNE